jgi:putative redox protein
MRKPLLVMHAPTDEVVGIENARRIYDAAKHPKSFVSLDGADHLLRRREDAAFVAEIVSAWARRYVSILDQRTDGAAIAGVRVRATGAGKFQHEVQAGRHCMLADEPVSYGGLDSGPTPYDFVAIGLAACTSMTLRLYAEKKGWQLPSFAVDVAHDKVHAVDCAECEGREGRIDRFRRRIVLDEPVDEEGRAKLLEIADKCPVHRTLEQTSVIATEVDSVS